MEPAEEEGESKDRKTACRGRQEMKAISLINFKVCSAGHLAASQ